MASFDEFTSAVQSCIEALKQAQAGMDSPKQQAEELSNQFQGLGAESMAVGAQGLKDGVEQSQAMIPPVITQLEQLITSAQGMKNSGLTAQTPEVRPPPTPLDAAPTHLREPVAKIGDPTSAPEEVSGAEDSKLGGKGGRSSRFLRSAARNAGDVQSVLKEHTSSNAKLVQAYLKRPPIETTASTVQQHGPVVDAQHSPGPSDFVSGVALTAVAASIAIKRFAERRRERKKL